MPYKQNVRLISGTFSQTQRYRIQYNVNMHSTSTWFCIKKLNVSYQSIFYFKATMNYYYLRAILKGELFYGFVYI